MAWIRVAASRLRAAFGSGRLDRDLAEELRSHIDMEMDANVARGMSKENAQRAAVLAFGGVTQTAEAYRDARGLPVLETVVQDIRYALRLFRKAPAFTSVAIVSLALGIGANSAIFGLVDTVLLRPLPVNDPQRIVTLSARQQEAAGSDAVSSLFSYPDYRAIRDRAAAAFSDILAYRVGLDGLSIDGHADRVMVHYVTGNYFTLLGVTPALGRLILPSEGERPAGDPVLVLGYAYWQSRFAGDPGVVGKRVLIDGHPVTIVGVAPRQFRSVQAVIDVQAYLPLGMVVVEGNYPRDVLSLVHMRMFSLVGRLRPGVTSSQARTVLTNVAKHLSDTDPTRLRGVTLDAQPEVLDRIPLGGSRRLIAVSVFLLAMAALVLALSCVNLANLLLVRAAARGREIAMRGALGGSRGRLIRQLLTESVVLAALGALAGLVVAAGVGRAFGTPRVQGVAIHLEPAFDWRLFAFAVAATALTGLMLGILPALRASRVDLANVTRTGGGGLGLAARRQRLRSVLVATQIAGAFPLLVVAGLLIRSLEHARRLDLGFDPVNVVDFGLDPRYLGFDDATGAQLFQNVLRRVRALPDVESASLGCCGPVSASPLFAGIHMDGYTPPPGQADPIVFFNQVSRDFFETLRIPIVRGRAFLATDDRFAPRVAIITQSMAEHYWPGRDPIGRQFQFAGDPRPWMQVVGVVKDGKYLGISDRPQPYFYVPLEQNYGSSEVLLVRSRAAGTTVMAEVQKEIAALAPGLPVTGVETMLQRLDEGGGFASLRRSAIVAAALGGLALVLALVGVFGVVSYSAEQRKREIGIRLALGAQPGSIRRLVLGEGVIVACAGLAAGVVLSLAAGPAVRRFLVGISPTDPLAFADVAILLGLVMLVACYIPVRSATRIDPVLALRQE